MTTPYRTSSELATAAPTAPLAPARYKPINRRAWTAMFVTVPVAVYAALIAAVFAGAFTGPFTWMALATLFALLIAALLRRRRRLIALVRRNDDAVALLNAGRVAEAAGALDALVGASRTQPLWNTIFVMNRAIAFLHQGELARARELLAGADDAGWLQTAAVVGFHGNLLTARAKAAALAGDLDEAEAWLARARAGLSPAKRGMLLPIDAVVALRRGRPADAIARIDAEWLDAEGALSAHLARTLRVLRAFALVQSSAPDPDGLRDTLAGARPFRPGEFDYLVVAWPELRAFLAEHGFVSAPAH